MNEFAKRLQAALNSVYGQAHIILEVTDGIRDIRFEVGDWVGYYKDPNKRVMLFGNIFAFAWIDEKRYYVAFIEQDGENIRKRSTGKLL